MAKFLEIGDHVWHEIGGPIGLVSEVSDTKALVEFNFRTAERGFPKRYVHIWYDFDSLTRTNRPLSND